MSMSKFVLTFITLLVPLANLAQTSTDSSLPCKKDVTGRASIGLALEGGVALGVAHVGVIKWLEENQIPVDCIAGTSMGGLIGALYSMGYTPRPDSRFYEKDINVFLSGLDWDGIFYDQTEYGNLTFMRKEDRRIYPTLLEFRFNRGLRLPEGLNAGHRVGLIFDRLAWPYSKLESFDGMGIPFRCVATDITRSKSDVFGKDVFVKDVGKEGTLSEALRSTMSLPGFFNPVHQQIDGKERIYVDGGLLQNIPTKVLKEMGADIVIAVHLKSAQIDSTSDLSFLDVVSNSLSVITAANENTSLDDLTAMDRCITVNLEEFKSTDFLKWEKIRNKGETDARMSFARCKKPQEPGQRRCCGDPTPFSGIQLPCSKWEEYKHRRMERRCAASGLCKDEWGEEEYKDRRKNRSATGLCKEEREEDEEPHIKPLGLTAHYVRISISSTDEPDSARRNSATTAQQKQKDAALGEQIRQGLSCKQRDKGAPGDYDCPKYVKAEGSFGDEEAKRLEQQLNRMVGTGRFERLGYHMRSDEKGASYLNITVSSRESAPVVLKPVVAIDGSHYTNPIFALGARFSKFGIGRAGSEWRGEVLLGSRYGASTEFYQPIFTSFSPWFIAPRATAESAPFNIYHDQDQLAHYQLRTISGGLDLGYNFSRSAQLRLGYEGGGIKLSRLLGASIFPFSSDRMGTTSLKFTFDRLKFSLYRLEAPVVPRNGVEWTSAFQWHDGWLGATNHFPTTTADLGLFKSVNQYGSIYLKADGGSTLGYVNNGLPSFSLGGPLRLAAYGTNELLINQYLHGSTGYVHRLYRFEALGGAIYATASFEIAKPYGLPGAPTLPKDGTAGVILDSMIGPLFVGGSVGDHDHRKFFFYLGRLF